MDINNWPEDQREALREWRSKDRSERHPNDLVPEDGRGHSRGVTGEECAQMRVQFKSDEKPDTVSDLADADFLDYSETTVAKHVFGRCDHEIDEADAESPMGPINPEEFVVDSECRSMRTYWHRAEVTITQITDEYEGRSYGQVYHHLVGRCKCNHGTPNIRSEESAE